LLRLGFELCQTLCHISEESRTFAFEHWEGGEDVGEVVRCEIVRLGNGAFRRPEDWPPIFKLIDPRLRVRSMDLRHRRKSAQLVGLGNRTEAKDVWAHVEAAVLLASKEVEGECIEQRTQLLE
jgi:hypothetical protein